MHILFLTNLPPYPIDNGGKIKSYTTLKSLAAIGHDVDLVCFNEKKEISLETEVELKKYCNRLKVIYLKLTTAENKGYMMKMAIKSLFSQLSFGLYKYCCTEMSNFLRELAKTEKYDCIYYDHLQLCVYKELLDELFPESKSILDEQNCEALIMSRYAQNTRNWIKKIFLRLETYKLRKFEIQSITSANKCIVLSQEDYSALNGMCGTEFSHEIIPVGVPDRGLKKNCDDVNGHLNILFIGTLTWEPNNHGMIWFLKNVVPLLEEHKLNYTLYIVGKNPSEELRKLTVSYENIVITGYVDSVDAYYDMCHCMVVPLFIGSGQRVKIIEAFSKGMPVISTSIGAEGLNYTNNVDVLIADDAETFVEKIVLLQNDKTRQGLAYGGRTLFEERYSVEAVQQKLASALEEF